MIWALSWMLATLPLFATWQDFSRKRVRAKLLESQGEVEEMDPVTDMLRMSQEDPIRSKGVKWLDALH